MSNVERLTNSAKRVVVETMTREATSDYDYDEKYADIINDWLSRDMYHAIYQNMYGQARKQFAEELFSQTLYQLKRNDYRTQVGFLDRVFQTDNEYGYDIAHQEVTTVIGCKGETLGNIYPLTEKNILILSMFYDKVEVPKTIDEMVQDILQYQDYLLIDNTNPDLTKDDMVYLIKRKATSDDYKLLNHETVVIDVGGKLFKLNNETYKQFMEEHNDV